MDLETGAFSAGMFSSVLGLDGDADEESPPVVFEELFLPGVLPRLRFILSVSC